MPDLQLKEIPEGSYISSLVNTLKILKKNNIRLKKTLGQNFLIDTNILKKIVREADIQDEDSILEIGSGIGTLTEILLRHVKKVICIEIDMRLSEIFINIFHNLIDNRVFLIGKDAMEINYSEITRKYKLDKVVSNLPYKIAAPVIIKLLMYADKIDEMYFTIQKDIAHRLLAGVGDRDYSSYTVKANFIGDFKILFKINRKCFYPSPFVDSVFLKIKRKKGIKNNIKTGDINDFFAFIDACFLHRRKMLINSVQASNNEALVDKTELIIKMLNGIGKDKSIRAEDLTLEEFLYIYNSIKYDKQ
jgi:16S rRNA (adenine1518-N6/adenine1519-N6)-dimethyltransferase